MGGPFENLTQWSGFHMAVENQTFWRQDKFLPFENRASPVFRWLLYFTEGILNPDMSGFWMFEKRVEFGMVQILNGLYHRFLESPNLFKTVLKVRISNVKIQNCIPKVLTIGKPDEIVRVSNGQPFEIQPSKVQWMILEIEGKISDPHSR